MSGRLKAWGMLVRLPNTTTVIADVLAGWLLVSGDWLPPWKIVLAAAAVVALYWAGMIFNDVADIAQDRRERPSRPLPSGAVSRRSAIWGGVILIVLAFAMTAMISLVTLLVSMATAAAILAYDLLVKKTIFAPLAMGLCRGGSLLLGAAAGGWGETEPRLSEVAVWWTVGAAIVYVAGFTLAGRREAAQSSRRDLTIGWFLAAVGVAMYAALDYVVAQSIDRPLSVRLDRPVSFAILVFILALPLARRAWVSWTRGGPTVGLAIRQAIFSLVFFDAAIALQYGSTMQAITITLLIIPPLVLSRWFYAT